MWSRTALNRSIILLHHTQDPRIFQTFRRVITSLNFRNSFQNVKNLAMLD